MIFTSESVSPGHPDKICDQISDAILDAAISQDKESRVAVEVIVKDNNVILIGEITTNAKIDYTAIIRKTIIDIGYNKDEYGFNGNTCNITNILGEQSKDISTGIDESKSREQGAGDQGLMFGYADNSTTVLMPAPIVYAHLLVKRQAELLKNKSITWLRPDAKSQISCIYENNNLIGIDSVVLSTQHDANVNMNELRETILEEIIKPTLPKKLISNKTKYHINPAGSFIIGGPVGDAGLTGRKIIVDTYGGAARHGGGAFSGKDPSKVDRSGAYAARYIAKNIVAAGLAKKCEIQISYIIGLAEPAGIYVNTFGTGKKDDKEIVKLIIQHFDLKPKKIIEKLDLKKPIYQKTANYGHFGREEPSMKWETTNLINILKND